MKVTETILPGAVIVETPVFQDARGGFQRLVCENSFAAAGLPHRFVQANLSVNTEAGILRGLHYQTDPHAEDKLVRCVSGAILDVAADIRRKIEIGSYQGIRHRRGLPVHGQRTKTNARTRKGP